jgi:hypothetical protein
MGLGVKDDETYSHRLEKMLLADGIGAEVINMGVPGFGTAEELIQFQEVAKKYRPDVVVMGFFYNDYMNNAICGLFTVQDGVLRRSQSDFCPGIYIRDRLNLIPGYSFLSQHSHLMTLARNAVSYAIIDRLEHKVEFHDPHVVSDRTDRNVMLTKALLEQYVTEVTKTGARLYIVDLADKSWVSCFPTDIQHDDKTRCISTFEAFSDARDTGRQPFYPMDGHPTADGHKVIAECIYKTLQQDLANGVLVRK